MQWKQCLGVGMLLAMASVSGVQARPSAAQLQAQMEASMNVAGELTLTPDGSKTYRRSNVAASRSRPRQTVDHVLAL